MRISLLTLSITSASLLAASFIFAPPGDTAGQKVRWLQQATQAKLRFWFRDQPGIAPDSLRIHFVRPDGTKDDYGEFTRRADGVSTKDLYDSFLHEKPAQFTWSISSGSRTLKSGSFQVVRKTSLKPPFDEYRYIVQHGDSDSAKALGLPPDSGEPWPVIPLGINDGNRVLNDFTAVFEVVAPDGSKYSKSVKASNYDASCDFPVDFDKQPYFQTGKYSYTISINAKGITFKSHNTFQCKVRSDAAHKSVDYDFIVPL